jgi:hypothetical protein
MCGFIPTRKQHRSENMSEPFHDQLSLPYSIMVGCRARNVKRRRRAGVILVGV